MMEDTGTGSKKRPATTDVAEGELAISKKSKVSEDKYISPTEAEITLVPIESHVSGDIINEIYGSGDNCIHHCVRNKSEVQINPKPYPEKLAHEYPYELDTFQKRAVLCLENNESVLVAAHTSAGKTTVAEYAIGMSFRNNESVVYTSPIKALSNQKYRDLQAQFGVDNVGLMTGDVTLNKDARLMVMTTEILRSMLYLGSEITRQVKWVVFDEVHYMNDRERGVIWEETIILLPETVRFVFLSATIPNADEFAGWINTIKHQPCHTIYTDYRPVPLQHYIHAQGNDLFLVVDAQKRFLESMFQQAIVSMENRMNTIAQSRKKDQGKNRELEELISYAHKNTLTPMIVFQFSKRATEDNANALGEEINLTNDEEKETIRIIYNSARSTLSEDDKELPQITGILDLLERGIGIHHGGLLPVVKELVELLFGEGLLKVLFATETFAMGVNMPARTVVFSEIRKFDGAAQRLLEGGEYIQMSGRAGRRNVDDQGMVIVMMNQRMEPDDAKDVFTGEPIRLNSQFRLTYNMLLNVLKLSNEHIKPQWIIKRSFKQYQVNRSADSLEKNKVIAEAEYKALPPIPFCDVDDMDDMVDDATDLFGLSEKVSRAKRAIRLATLDQKLVLSYLSIGRIVEISTFDKFPDPEISYGCGVIIGRNVFNDNGEVMGESNFDMSLNVLLEVDNPNAYESQAGEIPDIKYFKPVKNRGTGSYVAVRCPYRMIESITHITADKKKMDFANPDKRRKIGNAIFKMLSEKGITRMSLRDFANHGYVSDTNADKLMSSLRLAEEAYIKHRLSSIDETPQLLEWVRTRKSKRLEISDINKKLSFLRSSILDTELTSRLGVLRDLGYIDGSGILTEKGRISCEIRTADEILVSELLLEGIFNKMVPEETCAVLTALLFDESKQKQREDEIEHEQLRKHYGVLKQFAEKYRDASVKNRIPEEMCKKIVDSIDPILMDFVFEWTEGNKSFKELMETYGDKKKLYEGSVVRVVRRLEELLRQLAYAAKCMENEYGFTLFIECIKKIKKGIIFAASLYL